MIKPVLGKTLQKHFGQYASGYSDKSFCGSEDGSISKYQHESGDIVRVKPPITQLRTSFERREASIHKPNRHRNSHTSLPPECSHDLDYQMQPNKWAGKSIPIEVRYKHK